MQDVKRTFVVGDIHGGHRAFMQCLGKMGFDYDKDILICLGDVCDGWPEPRESMDEMMKMKNLVYLLGNHDVFTLEWATTGVESPVWLRQGGESTIRSFRGKMDDKYIDFLKDGKYTYQYNNTLFVHAGINTELAPEDQEKDVCIWDRSLVKEALRLKSINKEKKLTNFDAIFVGHTPTINFSTDEPIKACEIWMLDTGAGWHGPLTMMDIETKQYVQSDPVAVLYPNYRGRY